MKKERKPRGIMKTLAIICMGLFSIRCDLLVTVDARDRLATFEKGIWNGTFDFSLDIGPLTRTQSGILSFEFCDSTYKYAGEVQYNTLSIGIAPYTVTDSGPYKTTDTSITFADRAHELGAMWVPSLYLYGEYLYRFENDVLTITKIGPSQASALVLKRKKGLY